MNQRKGWYGRFSKWCVLFSANYVILDSTVPQMEQSDRQTDRRPPMTHGETDMAWRRLPTQIYKADKNHWIYANSSLRTKTNENLESVRSQSQLQTIPFQ